MGVLSCGWISGKSKLLTVLHRLMDIAKEMTREALPIKCLEAVILGMYPYDSQTRCMLFSSFHFFAKKQLNKLSVCSLLLCWPIHVFWGIQIKASYNSMLFLVDIINWLCFTSWQKVRVPFVMSDKAESAELYV